METIYKYIKTNVGIIGAAGYTGGELIRLLSNHPMVHIAFAHSRSHSGQPVSEVHQDLAGDTDMIFISNDSLAEDLAKVEVLFLCLGLGASRTFLSETPIPQNIKIIDLTNDFRLKAQGQNIIGNMEFVYGLPELNRKDITKAHAIANPGCFATAIQLALMPLASLGILSNTYITGITGSTGAGQSLIETSHFSWRTNNIQAYKTLNHQHMHEITETINTMQSKPAPQIHFVPWRGDFARGIFVSAQVTISDTSIDVKNWYKNFYDNHPYTHIVENQLHLKQVINTNKCLIQIEQVGAQIVIHAAIDNLIKGASGQAIQNMNLMMGWPETAGLQLKSSAF